MPRRGRCIHVPPREGSNHQPTDNCTLWNEAALFQGSGWLRDLSAVERRRRRRDGLTAFQPKAVEHYAATDEQRATVAAHWNGAYRGAPIGIPVFRQCTNARCCPY